MTERRLRVAPDPENLAVVAEEVVAAALLDPVSARGRARVALAGGSTPLALYRRLARRADLPWSRVDLLLGDERGVPPDHPESNLRAIRESLLTGPAAGATLHPVSTAEGPAEAARRQHDLLERLCGAPPRLDLVLLGMGEDGHTASLFPGRPALEERERWAVATDGPRPGSWRVTITLPVLAAARRIVVLVAGEAKRETVRRVFSGEATAEELPIVGAFPERGELLWLLDRAAAGGLS